MSRGFGRFPAQAGGGDIVFPIAVEQIEDTVEGVQPSGIGAIDQEQEAGAVGGFVGYGQPHGLQVRIAIGLSVAGAMIEVIQAMPFVARDADVFDWVADTVAIGAVMGSILAARLRRAAGGP